MALGAGPLLAHVTPLWKLEKVPHCPWPHVALQAQGLVNWQHLPRKNRHFLLGGPRLGKGTVLHLSLFPAAAHRVNDCMKRQWNVCWMNEWKDRWTCGTFPPGSLSPFSHDSIPWLLYMQPQSPPFPSGADFLYLMMLPQDFSLPKNSCESNSEDGCSSGTAFGQGLSGGPNPGQGTDTQPQLAPPRLHRWSLQGWGSGKGPGVHSHLGL